MLTNLVAVTGEDSSVDCEGDKLMPYGTSKGVRIHYYTFGLATADVVVD